MKCAETRKNHPQKFSLYIPIMRTLYNNIDGDGDYAKFTIRIA